MTWCMHIIFSRLKGKWWTVEVCYRQLGAEYNQKVLFPWKNAGEIHAITSLWAVV